MRRRSQQLSKITPRRLYEWAHSPLFQNDTAAMHSQICLFLARETPLRMKTLSLSLAPLQALLFPSCSSPLRIAIEHLESTYNSVSRDYSACLDSRTLLLPSSAEKDFHQLVQRTARDIENGIDAMVGNLKAELAPAVRTEALTHDHNDAGENNPATTSRVTPVLQKCLDETYFALIELRVLWKQYGLCHARQQQEHQTLPLSVVTRDCKLRNIVQDVIEDVQALSLEKNSLTPPIKLVMEDDQDKGLKLNYTLDYQLHYVLLELLKNAVQAHITRYADPEDGPPILVHVSSSPSSLQQKQTTKEHNEQQLGVKISDRGEGMSYPHCKHHIFRYFYSTTKEREATYTYGPGFGVPFSGIGVGMPLARLHARWLGGVVEVSSLPGHGADAYLHLFQQ
ncbi:Protein-serine/threonine kinase [Balamuthia mandrillaris]